MGVCHEGLRASAAWRTFYSVPSMWAGASQGSIKIRLGFSRFFFRHGTLSSDVTTIFRFFTPVMELTFSRHGAVIEQGIDLRYENVNNKIIQSILSPTQLQSHECELRHKQSSRNTLAAELPNHT